jgi:hypothetical protein
MYRDLVRRTTGGVALADPLGPGDPGVSEFTGVPHRGPPGVVGVEAGVGRRQPHRRHAGRARRREALRPRAADHVLVADPSRTKEEHTDWTLELATPLLRRSAGVASRPPWHGCDPFEAARKVVSTASTTASSSARCLGGVRSGSDATYRTASRPSASRSLKPGRRAWPTWCAAHQGWEAEGRSFLDP